MRFAKLFDVLSRAVKRLLGRVHDIASKSFDSSDCRGQLIDRDIIDRTIRGAGGLCCSLCSATISS
jgi:hypothetical protein